MEIVFIGTGSGKTSLNRFHSSIFIKDKNILIDTGDGISKALLKNNISFNSIDTVLITHYHADHFTGIASLVTQMKLIGRNKELRIFTHNNLITPLVDLLNSVYMFKETLGFDLQIIGYNFVEKNKISSDTYFLAKRNTHITQKDFLKNYPSELFISSSILIESGNKFVIFTSDIGSETDLFLFKDFPVDCVIAETTHISIESILKVSDTSNPKKILLTHISEEDEVRLAKWHSELSPEYKAKINIAYDGMIVKV